MSLFVELLIFNVFFSTGVSKLFRIKAFAEELKLMLDVKRIGLLFVIAFTVSILEIGAAVLIMMDQYHLFSAILLIPLLIIFNLIISTHLKKNSAIRCNCGGLLGNEQIHKGIIYRNFVLIGFSIYSIFFHSNTQFMDYILNFELMLQLIFIEILVLFTLFIYQFVSRNVGTLKNMHME